MEGVTATETFEIEEMEDGVEEDEESSEEVEDKKGPEDESAADSRDESTDWDGLHCEEVFEEETAYLEHDEPVQSVDAAAQLDGLLVSTGEGRQTLCCSLCGRIFSDSRGFHSHMMKHRSELSKDPDAAEPSSRASKQHIYECELCGKSYAAIGHFLNHQRSHKQASKSVFHELAHLKKKSFQCHTCGRSYSRASALDAHRRCHEVKLVKSRNKGVEKTSPAEGPLETGGAKDKDKPEQADDTPKLHECACGKAFNSQSGLRTHQRFSHNDKCSPEKLKREPKPEPKRLEFKCIECDKTYGSRVALVSHQRWHTNRSHNAGEKFSCKECGKVFLTLTFYYKHQRLAHSEEETAAKSFLHQVCQLQKKAFECQDCGLKFSRASALQSHQLSHIDVFKEAEKLSSEPTDELPQHELLSNKEETELQVTSQDSIPAPLTETDASANETDGDMDDVETGDLNVEVISVSASDDEEDEEETMQDLNPDLELLCESDQEGKEETENDFYQTEMSPRTLQSKSDIGLKIVEIDFGPLDGRLGEEMETGEEISNEKGGKHIQPITVKTYTCDICGHESKHRKTHYNHLRKHEDPKPYKNVLYQLAGLEKNSFKCDECGKCFSRLSALQSHQRHHPKTKPHQCPDCKTSFSHSSGLYYHRKHCPARQKPKVDDSNSKKEGFNPKKTLLGPKVYHCEQCGKGFWSLGAYSHHKQNQTQCSDSKGRIASTASSSSRPIYGHPHLQVACPVCGRKFRHRGVMKSHMRKHENGNHKCELCGRSFRLFSSLLRHQVVHNTELLPPPSKSFQHQVEQVKKNMYSCPDCGKRFSRAKALQFHMKSHGYETGYSPSSPRSALELAELQCSTCHAHFSNKSSLHSHQKLCVKNAADQSQPDDVTPVSSSNNAAEEKTVKCPNCLSLFTSLLSLQYHRKQCSKRKSTDGGLAVKKKRGRKKKSLLANNDQLEKNEAGETKSQNVETSAPSSVADLKYKCKECERSFAVVGALNFHKRIHLQGYTSKATKMKLQPPVVHKKLKPMVEPKGQFFCSECGRRFISNAALGTHRRWHTDKKFAGLLVKDEMTNSVRHKSLDDGPFHCNKCGKGFFYLCVLRRHQLYYPPCQTKAEPEPEADTNVGNSKPSHTEFACPECDKTFVRGSLLAAHYETHHSKSSERADLQEDQTQAVSSCKVLEPPASERGKSDACPSKKPEVGVSAHQCPHCDQSFVKIRGLRAHKWQAHSRRVLSSSKGVLPVAKRNKVTKKDDTEATKATVTAATCTQTFAKRKRTRGKRRKRANARSVLYKSIQCLDCGKRYSSPGALYNHKKVCLVLKQEIKPVKTLPEEHLPPNHLSESTAKCFFKCDKCGKAFPTEEQLGGHKELAKSRPYCCALCCRGYWTETQLQQHLAWHDEVRRRLPAELRYRLSATMSSDPAQLNDFPLHDNKKANLPSLKRPATPNPVPRSQNGHKCQHCGKAFLSPAALQNHEAQHNSDDSYRCSLCPRTFSEIRDLIDHHQECMGEEKGPIDAHTSFRFRYTDGLTCLECGISFSREIELHQHYIEHARGAY